MPPEQTQMRTPFEVVELRDLIVQQLQKSDLKSIALVSRAWNAWAMPLVWSHIAPKSGLPEEYLARRCHLVRAVSVYEKCCDKGTAGLVLRYCSNLEMLRLSISAWSCLGKVYLDYLSESISLSSNLTGVSHIPHPNNRVPSNVNIHSIRSITFELDADTMPIAMLWLVKVGRRGLLPNLASVSLRASKAPCGTSTLITRILKKSLWCLKHLVEFKVDYSFEVNGNRNSVISDFDRQLRAMDAGGEHDESSIVRREGFHSLSIVSSDPELPKLISTMMPGLREVKIKDTVHFSVLDALSESCPNLEMLEIPYHSSPVHAQSWINLLKHSPRLRKLCLDKLGFNQQCIETLLTHCQEMEELHLPQLPSLTEQNVQGFLRVWPRLRSLRLEGLHLDAALCFSRDVHLAPLACATSLRYLKLTGFRLGLAPNASALCSLLGDLPHLRTLILTDEGLSIASVLDTSGRILSTMTRLSIGKLDSSLTLKEAQELMVQLPNLTFLCAKDLTPEAIAWFKARHRGLLWFDSLLWY